jgi:putative acetyltransferase
MARVNAMQIRKAEDQDLEDVLRVEQLAFGRNEEADLTLHLLKDSSSADPRCSLLAYVKGRAVGHILFTGARLEPALPFTCSLLAPLAVVPEFQRRGVGSRLVEEGLNTLRDMGIDLVFVLGHPEYYERHGFTPAGRLGIDTPHPIPDECAPAWMVQELKVGILDKVKGRLVCANALDKPEYWRE